MDIKKLYKSGKKKAFTLSYDDGIQFDVRMVEILNKNGVKCTFNINSALSESDNGWERNGVFIKRLPLDELIPLYTGHEVAIHTATHPHLNQLTKEEIYKEVTEDKKALSEKFGYDVRGMAYPFGSFNDEVIEALTEMEVPYSRTAIKDYEAFDLPTEFLKWDGIHHNNPKLKDLIKNFIETDKELALMYVWGHSFEFECDNNWYVLENLCEDISNKEDIWYATNIEIYDYIKAMEKLKITEKEIINGADVDLWVSIDGTAQKINAKSTLTL